MELENAILILIGSFFLIFPIERFMRVFFEKRQSSTTFLILTYLFYPTSMTIARVFIRTPAVPVLTLFSALLIISLNYNASWWKRITAIISIFAMGLMIELSVVTISGFYLTSLFVFTEVLDIFTVIAVVSVSFLLALLLQNFKNIKRNTIVFPIFWFSALVLPISSIVLGAIVVSSSDLSTFMMLLAIALILAMDVLIFYLHDNLAASHEHKLHSALYAQEKEYYLTQCQLMRESVEKMTSIKHDMKIHLAAIKGYVAENKNDATMDYLNKLLDDIGKGEIYSNTGNIAIDSIINFKLKNAKKEGINPKVRLLVPPALNVDVADLSTIIGNLLDNVLEAVAMVKEKKVTLVIEYSRESLYIQVDNTFDGIVKYAKAKNDEQRIVTRKDETKEGEHGHGLKNILRSVKKYCGHMDISHEDNIFSVTILLLCGTDTNGT